MDIQQLKIFFQDELALDRSRIIGLDDEELFKYGHYGGLESQKIIIEVSSLEVSR